MYHLDNHKRDTQFLVLSGHMCTMLDVFGSKALPSGTCSESAWRLYSEIQELHVEVE